MFPGRQTSITTTQIPDPLVTKCTLAHRLMKQGTLFTLLLHKIAKSINSILMFVTVSAMCTQSVKV